MPKRKSALHETQSRPRVGVKVIIRMANSDQRVEIVEDRGPIGIGGRRLIRVRPLGLDYDGEPMQTYEVPVAYITKVLSRPSVKKKTMRHTKTLAKN